MHVAFAGAKNLAKPNTCKVFSSPLLEFSLCDTHFLEPWTLQGQKAEPSLEVWSPRKEDPLHTVLLCLHDRLCLDSIHTDSQKCRRCHAATDWLFLLRGSRCEPNL